MSPMKTSQWSCQLLLRTRPLSGCRQLTCCNLTGVPVFAEELVVFLCGHLAGHWCKRRACGMVFSILQTTKLKCMHCLMVCHGLLLMTLITQPKPQ